MGVILMFVCEYLGNGSDSPRRTERFAPQAIGFAVTDVLVFRGVVFELTPQEQRVVGSVTRDVCVAGRLGVGLRLVAGLDAVEEHAREDLGMVKEGEVFYQVVE
mgnify:CR=1 FL=1